MSTKRHYLALSFRNLDSLRADGIEVFTLENGEQLILFACESDEKADSVLKRLGDAISAMEKWDATHSGNSPTTDKVN